MKKKRIYAVITAAVVLAGSIFAVNEYNDTKIKAPELTTCVDNENGISVLIGENEVPLGNTEVSTKTSTKKSKKTVKLKKASKKTYSKTKNSSKTNTKNTKSGNESIETVTKIDTTVLEKYKKKSKKKTVMTTVKTTVTTTTTTASSVSTASSTGAGVSTASAGAKNTSNGTISINSIAPNADSAVLSAFNQLGFNVVINSGVSYSGMFDAKSQSITMKANNSVIYHELGHFVAFAAGNADKQSDFAAIYNAEKGKYTESDKAYVTQNASEYFAQSYKNYVENPSALSSSRPQTFAFMQKSVAAITSTQVSYIQSVYGAYWASKN